jgi:hypothetical protein
VNKSRKAKTFLERRNNSFRNCWHSLSAIGVCDGVDGAEYTRVFGEWISYDGDDGATAFIRRRANIGPDGREPHATPR